MHASPDRPKPTTAALALDRQRAAQRRQPYPTHEERRDTLLALERILVRNARAIADALSADFGHHSVDETIRYEIFPAIDTLRHTRRHLRSWMRSRSRPVSLLYATASNRVVPQPRGIVGVIVPWNAPIFCCFLPLASIVAAGNRALVKMSSATPRVAALLAELCASEVPAETLAFVSGISGSAFTALSFDHLMFTGSPETGRAVMRNAAERLIPVTLELGGKSPAIVCDDFDLDTAAQRILYQKALVAGQVCVATDYVFLPAAAVEAFVECARRAVSTWFPDADDPGYTAIVDARSYERLRAILDDARDKGARVIPLTAPPQDESARKMAPHLVLDVTDEMTIMREEIFGPLLPVRTYSSLDDAISYINARERPLALYVFTNDPERERKVLFGTMSGSVGVNHAGFQLLQHDVPFGGIGTSGMGHYRGYEGFLEFSKLRPVVRYPRASLLHLVYPPYRAAQRRLFDLLIRTKP